MAKGMEAIFWDFSIALYRSQGIKAACLALQDESGLDVNMLLYCCWAGQGGHRFSHEEMRRLHALSSSWQGNVMRAMRQLRQRIGQEPDAEGCYAAAKSLELQLERVEQSRLLHEVPVRWGKGGREIATANLRAYLMLAAVVRDQIVNRHLEQILDAMSSKTAS